MLISCNSLKSSAHPGTYTIYYRHTHLITILQNTALLKRKKTRAHRDEQNLYPRFNCPFQNKNPKRIDTFRVYDAPKSVVFLTLFVKRNWLSPHWNARGERDGEIFIFVHYCSSDVGGTKCIKSPGSPFLDLTCLSCFTSKMH